MEAAAVSVDEPAPEVGNQLPERGDAVLKGHGPGSVGANGGMGTCILASCPRSGSAACRFTTRRSARATLLCIHGTGSSSALWLDAARELAKRGRAILYDRRGFSRRERPEPFVTTVRQQADDAAALLDGLRAAPAVVMGRSQGGEIAVDLALRYPDRVRALVLMEGGGLALSAGLRQWIAALDAEIFAAAETDVDKVGETLVRGVAGDEGWEALPEPVRAIFTANSPAIVAEERGGLLDVTVEQLGASPSRR